MSRHKSVASDDLFPEDVDSLRLAARCNAQARFAFCDDHPAALARYESETSWSSFALPVRPPSADDAIRDVRREPGLA